MEKKKYYESPKIKEIVVGKESILCASQFGTEGMSDRSGSYDEWDIN